MWNRRWYFYVSSAEATVGELRYSMTKKLGFVSYWLIRWVHGRDKLWEMSAQGWLNKELSMGLFQRRE